MLQTYCVLSEIGVQKLEYQVGLVTVTFEVDCLYYSNMIQNKLPCCAGVPTLMIEFTSRILPDDLRHAGQTVREGRRGQQLPKEASRMEQDP